MGNLALLGVGGVPGLDIVNAHTIAKFPFSEGTGTTSASDPNAGSYTATLRGGATWDTDVPTGIKGKSISLNGTTGYITIPNVFSNSTKTVTLSFWVKFGASYPTTTDKRILWCTNTADSRIDLLWRNTSDNGGYLWLIGTKGGVTTISGKSSGGYSLASGTWYHFEISIGFAHVKVKVDGTTVISTDLGTTVQWTNSGTFDPFTFGCQNEAGSQAGFVNAKFAEPIFEARQWEAIENTTYRNTKQGYWTVSRKLVKATNSVLSPSVAWEGTTIQEPTFLERSNLNQLVMGYTGHYGSPQGIGYATTADSSISFSKYASNPIVSASSILGGGFLYEESGTFYLYYRLDLPNSDLYVRTSTDLITWSSATSVLSATAAAWMHGIGNVCVRKTGPGVYRAMVEAMNGSSVWQLGSATASSPTGGFTMDSGSPLTFASLNPFGNFGCSGPDMWLIGSTWWMFYHVAKSGSNLPTNIMLASASAFEGPYTRYSDLPITSFTKSEEVDQLADVQFTTQGGVRGFFTQNDNVTPAGKIGMVTYSGTMQSLVTDGSA